VQHADSSGWGAGDQTPHLLWRVMNGELGPLQPKVMVILIGTNDLGAVVACPRNWLGLSHCKDPTKVRCVCHSFPRASPPLCRRATSA
jgi:hypothetical protein